MQVSIKPVCIFWSWYFLHQLCELSVPQAEIHNFLDDSSQQQSCDDCQCKHDFWRQDIHCHITHRLLEYPMPCKKSILYCHFYLNEAGRFIIPSFGFAICILILPVKSSSFDFNTILNNTSTVSTIVQIGIIHLYFISIFSDSMISKVEIVFLKTHLISM